MTGTTTPARAVTAPRGGCTPCGTERKTREKLASPAFPATFPCPHPQAGPVPGFPLRYAGDRHCPGCAMLAAAEIVVEGPASIAYGCGQGHEWAAASPAKVGDETKENASGATTCGKMEP